MFFVVVKDERIRSSNFIFYKMLKFEKYFWYKLSKINVSDNVCKRLVCGVICIVM